MRPTAWHPAGPAPAEAVLFPFSELSFDIFWEAGYLIGGDNVNYQSFRAE